MIITKTPFRMSFFGGGTDMENFLEKMVVQFYQQHLINTVMSMYVICRDFLTIQQKSLTLKQKE